MYTMSGKYPHMEVKLYVNEIFDIDYVVFYFQSNICTYFVIMYFAVMQSLGPSYCERKSSDGVK